MLVAISIPIFTSQLEKSRQATDAANIRAAYAEVTSMYLAKLLESYNIKVTRLAYGLQIGGNLDYVDPLTLSKALEGRHKI